MKSVSQHQFHIQFKKRKENAVILAVSMQIVASSYLPMECREQPSFGFLNEILHTRLKAEPFEFARDQFVAGHHWRYILLPIGTNQWTAAGLLGFESIERY